MNKKGLIGKILLIIGIIIFLLIGFIAISAYQVYGLVNTVQTERVLIEQDVQDLAKGNCSKIIDIEVRLDRIQGKAESVCGNPLIRAGLSKVENPPFSCDDLGTVKTEMLTGLDKVKEACNNMTSGDIKINDSA